MATVNTQGSRSDLGPALPSGRLGGVFNIASYLPQMARRVPDQLAVIVPWERASREARAGLSSVSASYAQWTFSQLEDESNRLANGLASAGMRRGDRVIVMVRPGLAFTGVIFALFKLGAVPVMIDPGMGVGRMVDCLARIEPDGFIGVSMAQLIVLMHRRRFSSLRVVVTVGRGFWGCVHRLRDLRRTGSPRPVMAATAADEPAAVLFTTGSTGPPKGVVYEHGMFGAQVEAIRSCYGMMPGEVDLPAFPLFALFSTAMGMTCVIPRMDPSRPARVNPARIVSAIERFKVTNAFGSPAIWRRVAAYCVERGIRLPTLRRVLTAGAPIPPSVIAQLHRVLSKTADVHTPYGATESLPVASISGRELFDDGLAERARRGAGTCVGRPLPGMEVGIIAIDDGPIGSMADVAYLPPGERGEIVVTGPVVTRQYDHLPEATALAKIRDGDRVWHRMGDVGYFDPQGRLWFCGRKAHRVETADGRLFTVECEAVFNEHPDVYRSALVGVGERGRQIPVLVVEPLVGRFPRGRRRAEFVAELRRLGAACPHTRVIERFLFHRSLPVDIRHNAKIFREKLAPWAAERMS